MFQKIAILVCVSVFAATTIDDATRRLSHDIFDELIGINTTDSVGSTTAAANAMAKRLLDAGFPPADVKVLGPNDRKGNLVARIHGNSSPGLETYPHDGPFGRGGSSPQ